MEKDAVVRLYIYEYWIQTSIESPRDDLVLHVVTQQLQRGPANEIILFYLKYIFNSYLI